MKRYRVLTVVGARPQFIKAALPSRLLRSRSSPLGEFLVHTGQHYDPEMSQHLFDELGIPEPDVNLGVGSASHAVQTAHMLERLERVALEQRPDLMLIYGDTNSTLAGALVGAKLNVPVAHVEAGMRSHNRRMPEEINRIIADRLSQLLLCPSDSAVENLSREGITEGVHNVGDVMYDAVRHFSGLARRRYGRVYERWGLRRGEYMLLTVHRAENTDDPDRLRGLARLLAAIPRRVLFPVHPRTRERLREHRIGLPGNVAATGPVSYLEMLALQAGASAVLTDSGGVQKEAYYLGKPCITLRTETEWTELVELGWNRVVDLDMEQVLRAIEDIQRGLFPPRDAEHTPPYGDGNASRKIIDTITCFLTGG